MALASSVTQSGRRVPENQLGYCRANHFSCGKGAVRKQSTIDNFVNIGIDETSYKKGRKYITVIVNHDTNTVVWAAKVHGKSVLEPFFKQLDTEQRAKIHLVSRDGAR